MQRLSGFRPSRRRAIPVLILVVGVGLSAIAFTEARRADDQRVVNALEPRATWRAHDIQDKVLEAIVPVAGLATLIGTQKELDPDEFHGFAKVARGDNPIARLAWLPLVSGIQRAAFESMVRGTDGSPSFAISEFDTGGRLVPAGERDEYLPIRFEDTFGNVPSLTGFDPLSDEMLRASVQSARDTGKPIFSPVFGSRSGGRAATRTVLNWPVFRGAQVPTSVAERRAAFLGIVAAVYSIDDLFTFAVRDTPALVSDISLFLDLPLNEAYGMPTVTYRLDRQAVAVGSEVLGDVQPGGIRLWQHFDQMGRHWTLALDFPSEFVSRLKSHTPWAYLGLGLILTLALAGYVVSQQRRQSAVEVLVDERTRQLLDLSGQMTAIVQSSPLPTIVYDSDARVAVWNRAAERLFGIAAKDAIGNEHPLIPANEEAGFFDLLERLKSGEVLRGVESRRVLASGSIVEVATSAAAFHDSAGATKGYVFTLEDITERKRKEAAEHEITERLAAIVDTAVDGIIVIDAQGSVMLFNPAAERLFGYRADELIGRNIKMLMPSSYADEHDSYLGNYHRTAERKIIGIGREVVGRRKNGTTFPMHLSVGEAKQNGRPIFVGVVHDLTADRKADEKLRRTQDLLSGIVESTDDAIVSKTLEGIVTTWNAAAARIFGYSVEEMIGHHISVIAAPGHEDDMASILDRIRRGERVEHYETQRRRKDGTIIDISLTVSPLSDAQGIIFGASKIARDITQQKAAELALRYSREHLALAQTLGRIGSIEVDLRTDEAYWSDEVYRLHELDPLTGGPNKLGLVLNAMYPDDRPAFINFSSTLRRGAVPAPIESRVPLRDGGIRWIRRTAQIFTDETGPTRVLVINQDITESKRLEEQIARERDTAQRYLDVAAVMILVLNLDGTVAMINRKGCDILGYDDADHILGKYWTGNFIPERVRTEMGDVFRRLSAGNDPGLSTYENPILTCYGKERTIAWQNVVLRDDQGRPISTLSSGEDITARRQAEEASRENQERFAAIFHDSPAGIVITDVASGGKIIEANDAWLNASGYRRDEVIGRTSAELNLWADPDGRDRLYLDLSRPDVVWDSEVRVRRKDGIIINYATTMRQLNIAGRACVIALGFDVTDRKRAEDELRRSQDHLARVQNVAGIGSVEVDLVSGEVYRSEEVYRLVGIDAHSEGLSFEQFFAAVHPDDLPKMRAELDISLRGEESEPREFRVIAPDGAIRWLYRETHIVRDADGKPTRYIATIFDITERKAAEGHRSQLEQQLQQAQKMEAIGQLTGGVAHDFNNLLMVMMGNLELIQERVGADPKLGRWIADALDAGKSGSDLTHRLLAFSRRQTLEPEPTDINRRIAGFVPLIRRAIGEAVEIKQKLSESVWPVMIDPSQFDSAILNLAVNARDAMPGGGWIEIATENVTIDEAYAAQHVDLKAGDFVRVTVSDSGSGMSPEVLARAFEPFFTTKEVGKGTGLGLSMVYGFIKQSGGNVTIYSEVGTGTVIRLLLPRVAQAAKLGAELASARGPLATGADSILVLEDDAKVRAVTVAFLGTLGYRTLDVGTGGEALAILAEHPEVVLLLSDVVLAGGDSGPAVAEAAKKIRPNLKVLFASGYTEDALAHNGRLDPDVLLLHKPFTKSALSNKVREALGELPTRQVERDVRQEPPERLRPKDGE
jgi:PAS domain S-box-containing protein